MLGSATIDILKWTAPLAFAAIGMGALFAVEAYRLHGVENPAVMAQVCSRLRDDAAKTARDIDGGDLDRYVVLEAIISTHGELCGSADERARLKERVAESLGG